MTAQVILLPRDLTSADAEGKAVVVFDVLRATTTMTAALAAGVSEIRVFDSIDAARQAGAAFGGPRLMCGEVNCLPPTGFDLGNSPRDWQAASRPGVPVFMATTNGTRAIAAAAAHKPAALIIGAVINAAAAAKAAAATGCDITLLCAGSNGAASFEDLLGAGAVLDHLVQSAGCQHCGDAAHIALRLFQAGRNDLAAAMRLGAGGCNLIRVALEDDIPHCAALDSVTVVGAADPATLIVRRLAGSD